jgi:hypothetical protein
MAILMSLLAYACTDLDTYPQGDTLTEGQKEKVVAMIPERLAADISGMYALMSAQFSLFGEDEGRHDDFGYPMVCLSSDLNAADMVSTDDAYNWFSVASDFSDRTYTYANAYMRWALFYKQIKLTNDILATIPEDTKDSIMLYYKGQALAVRAFDYFSLIQLYQFTYKGNESRPGIPLIAANMLDPNLPNPRQRVDSVYQQILKDLDAAIPLLQGYTRPNKGYVDQQVAYGIRARVNLVMQRWSEAASDAAKARKGYAFLSRKDVSVPGFNSAKASSWIWALLISPVTIKDALGSWPSKLCSFTGNGYSTAVGCYKMINTLLWSKIPSSDVRKGWWVDEDTLSPIIASLSWPGYEGEPIGPLSVTDVKQPFLPYTNVKFGPYKDEIGNSENASDWCMMRAEEMLLIEAEALGMSGHLSEGKSILEDFVKNNRDSLYVCRATSPEAFQDEVWFQRRVELWGEGFGFTDLMRLKKNMVRFNGRILTNHPDAFKFNLAAEDPWLLLRIPQREVISNTGIPENANNTGGIQPESGAGAGLKDGVTD